MSTRSAIIAKIGDRYHGVYCHSDGYVEAPHGVGYKLFTHYQDPAKVAELVALGDLSCLGEVIGEKHDFDWVQKVYKGGDWSLVENDPRSKFTRAYHRDRGDPLEIAKEHTWRLTAKEIGHDGYVYVFEDNTWRVSREYIASGKLASLESLADLLAEIAASALKKSA